MSRRNLMCHYCEVRPGTTHDHIIPRVLCGPDTMWNIVPACPTCNGEKKGNWPTCQCEKCLNAVRVFLGDPGYASFALKILESRPGLIRRNIEGMKHKLADLEAEEQKALDVLETVRLAAAVKSGLALTRNSD